MFNAIIQHLAFSSIFLSLGVYTELRFVVSCPQLSLFGKEGEYESRSVPKEFVQLPQNFLNAIKKINNE